MVVRRMYACDVVTVFGLAMNRASELALSGGHSCRRLRLRQLRDSRECSACGGWGGIRGQLDVPLSSPTSEASVGICCHYGVAVTGSVKVDPDTPSGRAG